MLDGGRRVVLEAEGEGEIEQHLGVRLALDLWMRSLFYTTDVPTLRNLYPERQLFQEVSENARLIVSEPLGDIAGVWNEVPESTYGIVGSDHADMRPFQPKAPSSPVQVRA